MSLNYLFSKLKGGAGSGNIGHAGVPGKRGGSAPKGIDPIFLSSFVIEDVLKFGKKTGKEKLIAMDKDGNKLGETKGEPHQVSTKRIDKLENVFITVHNHPESAGFSLSDFATFANDKTTHMIAVGHDGTSYLLTKPPSWEFNSSDHSKTAIGGLFSYMNREIMRDNPGISARDASHKMSLEFSPYVGMEYTRIE